MEAEQAAKITLDPTLRQSQAGYVNYLMLLTAELTDQQAVATRAGADHPL